MRIRQKAVLFIVLVQLLFVTLASGQSQSRREIRFPDILGYKTLKCDFHMHTVFSDGSVWPTIRVDEAWREGLDAIAITDHIEYQPHKQDVPTNHKRPYEIASGRAAEAGILLPRSTEITRSTPPGHFNALFVDDIGLLDTEEFLDAVEAANKQNAFVFWNHPGWKPEFKGWFDVHTTLYENKWLHGIEVANGDSYYPEGHQWCLEKNLTMMGNSDMHQPSMSHETSAESHRTMTLVFVENRTLAALKDALVKGRTAVWYKNQLIGREKYLDAIFKKSVEIGKPHEQRKETIWVKIINSADIDIDMERAGTQGPVQLKLPANTTTILKTKVEETAEQAKLSYRVKNFLVAPDKGLPVDLVIDLQ